MFVFCRDKFANSLIEGKDELLFHINSLAQYSWKILNLSFGAKALDIDSSRRITLREGEEKKKTTPARNSDLLNKSKPKGLRNIFYS